MWFDFKIDLWLPNQGSTSSFNFKIEFSSVWVLRLKIDSKWTLIFKSQLNLKIEVTSLTRRVNNGKDRCARGNSWKINWHIFWLSLWYIYLHCNIRHNDVCTFQCWNPSITWGLAVWLNLIEFLWSILCRSAVMLVVLYLFWKLFTVYIFYLH